MNILFEQLFQAVCVGYNPDILQIPTYLRKDPMQAYARYAFEKGFRLAYQLAFTCLDPDFIADLD